MPYQWISAPRNESLVVHEKKLGGICYRCWYCDGWIEGKPNHYEEDTLAFLAGRRGTVEYCRRCGSEVNFFGVVS